MAYVIKYKRFNQFFYRSIKVVGHQQVKDSTRMDFFLPDNKGIVSIGDGNNYMLKLGADFMLEQKNAMERESGAKVTTHS